MCVLNGPHGPLRPLSLSNDKRPCKHLAQGRALKLLLELQDFSLLKPEIQLESTKMETEKDNDMPSTPNQHLP